MSCSTCTAGGENQILALPVPGIDNTEAAAVNVSDLIGCKTIELSGTYDGRYVVLGSHDGTHYSPVLTFDSGSGVQSARQTCNVILQFMKVRRRATNLSAIAMSIGSQVTCSCTVE